MYNICLYSLACEQRWVFNMLIAHIPSVFKFHAFGSFNIHTIHASLMVNHYYFNDDNFLCLRIYKVHCTTPCFSYNYNCYLC